MPTENTRLNVVSLCAQWCGVCRDWRPVLDQLAGSHPQVAWRWLDIEDEADLLDDLDVETFPTLLVAHYLEGRILSSFRQIDELIFNLLPQLERYEGRVRFSRQAGEDEAADAADRVPAETA